jgi:hypothetical protein
MKYFFFLKSCRRVPESHDSGGEKPTKTVLVKKKIVLRNFYRISVSHRTSIHVNFLIEKISFTVFFVFFQLLGSEMSADELRSYFGTLTNENFKAKEPWTLKKTPQEKKDWLKTARYVIPIDKETNIIRPLERNGLKFLPVFANVTKN